MLSRRITYHVDHGCRARDNQTVEAVILSFAEQGAEGLHVAATVDEVVTLVVEASLVQRPPRLVCHTRVSRVACEPGEPCG